MKRAAVINCSAPHYNLGAAKLSNWLRSQGYDVQEQSLGEVDLVCLSAIFSWHVPEAVRIAKHYGSRAQIWSGGPGFFAVQPYWFAQTGLISQLGVDYRFENHAGSYRMCFASRGCPVNCHFCIVTKMEGKEFTMNFEFTPAPILCDNNLSALPIAHQEFIISRYIDTGTPLLDANSGFEPKWFDEGTYRRWKPILRGPWRYAFDMMPEWRAVKRVCGILSEESSKKKRVYVLIGNEPMESCYERAMKVIEWGGEPFCQYELPLDFLGGAIPTKHDWTESRLKHFCRYFNRFLWKYTSLADYRCRELAPFEGMKFGGVLA